MPTTIAAALAQLPVTAHAGYVEFGEAKKVLALNGDNPGTGPLSAYIGVGQSDYAEAASSPTTTLGFDPFTVDAAVTVGSLPSAVTVVYGSFNATAVGAGLGKEGFKQHGTADGGTLWTYAADDKLSANNPTGMFTLNDMLVSANRIALGEAAGDVEAFSGSVATPLSSVGNLDAIAQCLGPALAAVISPRSTAANAPLLGIGLLAPSARDASEEVCVTASNASAAPAIAARWKSTVATGRSARLNDPWSTLLADPQATTLAPVNGVTTVRLTAEPAPGSRVGIVLTTFYSASSDLGQLLGPS